MKNFGKALDHDGNGFQYLGEKFDAEKKKNMLNSKQAFSLGPRSEN